ncbi:GNAT family N-acetyltransferase [Heyndrickxia oleronia]|uniref:GNAT family N-acetyltransferase n=1 Tax=Heyndrickxia oleronia TaxID=38875 RepID=UPI001B270416|nr:GNAT family protein [Heyndrickxia oleronia]GIN39243.1 N-acetyltransferase [Heyndrickxia oleronia]
MSFIIRKRTLEDVNQFLTWTYEGIYSFYDNNIQQEKVDGFKQSIDSDKAFSVVNEDNELVGNCEFFDVGDEGEEIIAVSVQMKPTFTGNGYGISFVNAIIEQGRELFKFNHLELIVVDFNIRAIKVYEKVGFRKIGEIENEIRGRKYNFIIMAKEWEFDASNMLVINDQ